MNRRQYLQIFGLASSLVTPMLQAQSSWPAKPIRIILQFPPGGSTDAVARILGQVIGANLGQPIVIENRPGADGAIAADYVARAEPDGYTYFLASNTPMMQVPLLKKNPSYDPIKSFSPVSLVGRYIYLLVASVQIPVNSAAELFQYIRSHNGKINYGSYSGVTQLMFNRLSSEARLDMNLIPYKGESPAINDILGGHVQLTFATPASALAHIKEGKLRALAVLLPNRYSLLPQVPTAVEAGVPPLNAGTWAALFAPARLPAEIAQKMSREFAAAIAKPEIREKIDRLGFDLASSTPGELAGFMPEQLQAWGKAFADAGMKPE
jgi:tripartite-type tricarboxylate transporter receptor subunit TctC